jgi:uncharacterized protein
MTKSGTCSAPKRVYQERRRQASWRDDDIRFHHFRDKDGTEVDIVLERGGASLA